MKNKISKKKKEKSYVRQTTFRADNELLHHSQLILSHFYGLSLTQFINGKLGELVQEHQDFIERINE